MVGRTVAPPDRSSAIAPIPVQPPPPRHAHHPAAMPPPAAIPTAAPSCPPTHRHSHRPAVTPTTPPPCPPTRRQPPRRHSYPPHRHAHIPAPPSSSIPAPPVIPAPPRHSPRRHSCPLPSFLRRQESTRSQVIATTSTGLSTTSLVPAPSNRSERYRASDHLDSCRRRTCPRLEQANDGKGAETTDRGGMAGGTGMPGMRGAAPTAAPDSSPGCR